MHIGTTACVPPSQTGFITVGGHHSVVPPSTTQLTSPDEIPPLPDELASPRIKLVYLSLIICEQATATDLQRSLGLSKLTLLPILAMLRTDGLIQRTTDGYTIA